ncbi:hypothetical protein N0M98_07400 [Paenibacillus doosanensis]|uniref:Uncharacterized protein n=1 Tax=Paenibacillus konkukensis TaxID=2020716 RepID=A0ABY4RRQ5_9BACL|nr:MULTISPECIES: hypothetical protein [Paenibacillus]MCS7459966.1 hypothetical protein [Paenibacillus doosanensis]UQZ84409.1 hypothetical protein SK3146_03655 [Paenibacillus konkukensis]
MNKTRTKVAISTLLLWAATIVGANADSGSTSVQPGSVDDPVITKSYFDQNIKQKIADELSSQSITEEKVRQIISAELGKNGSGSTTPAQPAPDASTPSESNGGSELQVIKLEQGQILYGGDGAEIIVRTGKVTVVSSDDNGIADVTSGKDIAAGAAIENNHLLIIPREGRGIKPDPKQKQDIYVMVRGSYVLTDANGTKITS